MNHLCETLQELLCTRPSRRGRGGGGGGEEEGYGGAAGGVKP